MSNEVRCPRCGSRNVKSVHKPPVLIGRTGGKRKVRDITDYICVECGFPFSVGRDDFR